MIVHAGLAVPATIVGFDGEPSVAKVAAATAAADKKTRAAAAAVIPKSMETRSMAQGPGKTKAGPAMMGLAKKATLGPTATVDAAPAAGPVAAAVVVPAGPGLANVTGAGISLLPARVPSGSGKGQAKGASKGKGPAKGLGAAAAAGAGAAEAGAATLALGPVGIFVIII